MILLNEEKMYFCSDSLIIKEDNILMDSKDNSQNNQEAYEKMMKDYTPSQYVNTEWEMQNGFYKQYSLYDDNCVSVSGTVNSIKAL